MLSFNADEYNVVGTGTMRPDQRCTLLHTEFDPEDRQIKPCGTVAIVHPTGQIIKIQPNMPLLIGDTSMSATIQQLFEGNGLPYFDGMQFWVLEIYFGEKQKKVVTLSVPTNFGENFLKVEKWLQKRKFGELKQINSPSDYEQPARFDLVRQQERLAGYYTVALRELYSGAKTPEQLAEEFNIKL